MCYPLAASALAIAVLGASRLSEIAGAVPSLPAPASSWKPSVLRVDPRARGARAALRGRHGGRQPAGVDARRLAAAAAKRERRKARNLRLWRVS
jgi:hypothetical protein